MYENFIDALREADKTARVMKKNPFRFSAYYGTAANVIEKLEKKVPKWIPVTERLPETSVYVLVCYLQNGKKYVDFDYIHKGEWRHSPRMVTHWQPVPEPPKDGE